jgi:hypothetical protein
VSRLCCAIDIFPARAITDVCVLVRCATGEQHRETIWFLHATCSHIANTLCWYSVKALSDIHCHYHWAVEHHHSSHRALVADDKPCLLSIVGCYLVCLLSVSINMGESIVLWLQHWRSFELSCKVMFVQMIICTGLEQSPLAGRISMLGLSQAVGYH